MDKKTFFLPLPVCTYSALFLLLPFSFFLPGCKSNTLAPRPELPSVVAPTLPLPPAEGAQPKESDLLAAIKQLSYAGKRSGEAYFHPDQTKIIFQSEREDTNPFYQIYTLNLISGEQQRVSPGFGKSTCAWFNPNSPHVLFSSTHEDADARKKQEAELAFRKSGKERRYSWDYDEHYEIYERDLSTGLFSNLTRSPGYDAEASYSPNGKLIAFTSNREAYQAQRSPADRERLAKDPAYFADIYIMNRDGSEVSRLTSSPGYDGGPFFSPDGSRIIWRRFSADGAQAEIYSMNIDGSDVKALSNLQVMSWAPFYHPSADYFIFSTNLHGFNNFELYIARTDALLPPVRVTFTDGFDGLPAFSPDGTTLAWTSTRGSTATSQIYLASWNDSYARKLLQLPESRSLVENILPLTNQGGDGKIEEPVLKQHVAALVEGPMAGRMTGSEGERLSTQYAADYLASLGFIPLGPDGSFFEPFEFRSGVELGTGNSLEFSSDGANWTPEAINHAYRPLGFTQSASFDSSPIVFAGYGIRAPEYKEQNGELLPAYDSYVHLDVKDKWVLVLRHSPSGQKASERRHLAQHASLRFKAMAARDLGAKGILIASSLKPSTNAAQDLLPLGFDASQSQTSVGVLSISNALAQKLLTSSGKNLDELESVLDSGRSLPGFEIPAMRIKAQIDVKPLIKQGRNVVAKLPRENETELTALVIGAHIDHLGDGLSSGSLATKDERGKVHQGADDNASGVAVVLELARLQAALRENARYTQNRDLIVALWSGEELGLLGSNHFVSKNIPELAAGSPPAYLAYINFDMVGRLNEKLMIHGIGSSLGWPRKLEQANVGLGLPLQLEADSYLPTDATSFYLKGVPILSAFTGVHAEYHTPRDTIETLNIPGMGSIGSLFRGLIAMLLSSTESLPYQKMEKPAHFGQRANLRVYLGTIPDYAGSAVQGMRLSGVSGNGPAEQAGLKAGDVIIELAGKKIENIYDYTYAIEGLRPGEKVSVKIKRAEETLELEVLPIERK